MKRLVKNIIFIVLILLLISSIFTFFYKSPEEEKEISIDQLVKEINQGEIKEIAVLGQNLSILYLDDSKAKSRKESSSSLFESLINYGANQENINKVSIEIKEENGLFGSLMIPLLLFGLAPLLLFGIFFWMIFRQAKGGANQAFNFSKSKARLFGANGSKEERIGFKDVAGLKEAKQELEEIVDFLKNPKKYLSMGAKIPRGILLTGPPGTGKTLLARAVATEAKVPFFSISGSEFVEMFVGVGSARARNLFAIAKKHQPSIIFIDELDAIGRHRGSGLGGGHDEREQTLNQILVEMDGFERTSTTLVFAATNRPDILDPALLRPGRFDRKVILSLPDIIDREEVLKIHCKGKPLALDVNLKEISERTPGFSGADLANVANEATILAARKDKKQIYQGDFIESIEKVLLGPERKSYILSKKEKEITAYHEAGHALITSLSKNEELIRKISIIARGNAAGYTLKTPSKETNMKTRSQFLSEIEVLLGGYSAEKLKFKEITTGASNDLKMASKIARSMIKQYGMSSLGPIYFGEEDDLVFLGKEIREQKSYSEKIAIEIDKEVNKIIKEAQKQAEKILSKNKNLLEKIAQRLIEKETIEREEFEELIKKGNRVKPKRKSAKGRSLKVKIRKV